MTSPDEFKSWTDKNVPVHTNSPDKYIDDVRKKASSSKTGVTKPFDNWLRSEDAKKYAQSRTGYLRKQWGKIGGFIRQRKFEQAASLWSELGREDKAEATLRRGMETRESLGRRPGVDSGNRRIRRGL